MASGIAVDQGAKADLVGNAGACEPFSDHADHDAEHGGATVEALSPLELIEMNFSGSCGLEPAVVGLGRGHECKAAVTNVNTIDQVSISRFPVCGLIQLVCAGSVAAVLSSEPCICRSPLSAPLKRTSPPDVLASTVLG